MSSSQPFASSPLSQGRRLKSAFTYKHLTQLSHCSTTTPLRVVAHIDLDAFYAQCEQVRLGLSPDQPLAVQQWQGLIAINYAARAFGLSRHVTTTEAQKACPEIILQHVATWKEGEAKWAYHDDAFKHLATHKVSLDPYRMESRKILAVIKEALPAAPVQRVEKAGIDEVFLDLSVQVHQILLERYPQLHGPPPYDDPAELLSLPPTTALDWDVDALVDLDERETEDEDPDWDDVAISIGSEIVRSVRALVKEKLQYTCSGGVARNKMLAKLGSAHKKPNKQTVIRNRAVQQFLSDFKFTKIRNLGGKLGDEVVAMFNTDTVRELLDASLEQLKRLGDDTGAWLYATIRGEDHSEVNPRTQIKSMLSAKSFRPSINTFEQGTRWLRIFAADIFSRCVEEGVLENKRRPKTINLHHRQGAQTRSRQGPIPQGKMLSEEMLFDLAKNLLAQVVVDGRAWPCANLSLSVGGFEDCASGNRGIGGFLVRGDEAKALLAQEREVTDVRESDQSPPPEKRRKIENGVMQRFFVPREESRDSELKRGETLQSDSAPAEEATKGSPNAEQYHPDAEHVPADLPPPSNQDASFAPPAPPAMTLHQPSVETYFCSRCNASIPLPQQHEHQDWHFAKDLAKEIQESERSGVNNARPPTATQSRSATPKLQPRGRGRPPGSVANAARGPEKGQCKLAFGKG